MNERHGVLNTVVVNDWNKIKGVCLENSDKCDRINEEETDFLMSTGTQSLQKMTSDLRILSSNVALQRPGSPPLADFFSWPLMPLTVRTAAPSNLATWQKREKKAAAGAVGKDVVVPCGVHRVRCGFLVERVAGEGKAAGGAAEKTKTVGRVKQARMTGNATSRKSEPGQQRRERTRDAGGRHSCTYFLCVREKASTAEEAASRNRSGKGSRRGGRASDQQRRASTPNFVQPRHRTRLERARTELQKDARSDTRPTPKNTYNSERIESRKGSSCWPSRKNKKETLVDRWGKYRTHEKTGGEEKRGLRTSRSELNMPLMKAVFLKILSG